MSPVSLATIAVLMLIASPAHARFGKRTAPNPSSKKSSAKASSESPQGGVRDASAVGTTASTPSVAPVQAVLVPASPFRRHRVGWFGATYAPVYSVAPAPQLAAREEEQPQAPVRLTVGGEVMGFAGGGSVGLGLGLEGERLGFTAAVSQLAVLADDGWGGFDTLKQLNGRFTYAVLTGSRGRLRIEGGADSVFAPDLIVVGPTVGASGVLWLAGPLVVEGAVALTPFPFRQIDYRAGFGLGFGALGIRAGWRTLLLDDAGLVDGIAHADLFSGPYLGASLVF